LEEYNNKRNSSCAVKIIKNAKTNL